MIRRALGALGVLGRLIRTRASSVGTHTVVGHAAVERRLERPERRERLPTAADGFVVAVADRFGDGASQSVDAVGREKPGRALDALGGTDRHVDPGFWPVAVGHVVVDERAKGTLRRREVCRLGPGSRGRGSVFELVGGAGRTAGVDRAGYALRARRYDQTVSR